MPFANGGYRNAPGYEPSWARGGTVFGGRSSGGSSIPGARRAAGVGGVGGGATTQSGQGGGGRATQSAWSAWPTGPAGGPDLGNWNIEKGTDPEMARARQRAEDYLGNLEKGAGYSMDVMQGSMQKQIDADITRAREAAAAQGLPFDEAAYRAKANADMQAGLAQEKLGREQMQGQMMANLQGVIAGEGERSLAKSGLELSRQGTRAGALNQRYGTQAGIYGTNVGKQIADMQNQTQLYKIAMDALQSFLNMSFSV